MPLMRAGMTRFAADVIAVDRQAVVVSGVEVFGAGRRKAPAERRGEEDEV